MTIVNLIPTLLAVLAFVLAAAALVDYVRRDTFSGAPRH